MLFVLYSNNFFTVFNDSAQDQQEETVAFSRFWSNLGQFLLEII